MPTMKIQQDKRARSPKNLGSKTIATTDIFKIQPIFSRETKAGDIFNIVHRQLNICDALAVPSFVNIKNRNTWFYVPYSKVWQSFETMLAGTTISMNQAAGYKVTQSPVLNPVLVLSTIMAVGGLNVVTTRPTVYDFRWKNNTVFNYCTFNAKGRRIWTMLQGLGYKLSCYFEANAGGVVDPATFGVSPSALQLFAYAKIYAENFVPSKYADKCNELISKMYNFQGSSVVTAASIGSGSTFPDTFTGPDATFQAILTEIFSMICDVYFGDDYFTSSPSEVAASPDGLNVNLDVSDITLPGTSSQTRVQSNNLVDYTPIHRGISSGGASSDTAYRPSEYIHNMLRIVTKNIQLKAIAGSKLSQRLYALYGNKSQTYNMEAVELDQSYNELDVKSITSVADTESSGGASLGQKGGQLNGYGEKKSHYEFNEFGFLCCINQVIPVYFYGEGMHREMMHIYPDDFYNDRYALAGYQNIGRFELFNNDMLGYYKGQGVVQSGSFGKTGAYAEYALRKDLLIGDFAFLSRSKGLDSYHFNRFLVDQEDDMTNDTSLSGLGTLPQNNEQFLKAASRSQTNWFHDFDRIFVDQSSGNDHIIQYNDFKCIADRYGRDINNFTIGEADGHETELSGLGKVLYG